MLSSCDIFSDAQFDLFTTSSIFATSRNLKLVMSLLFSLLCLTGSAHRSIKSTPNTTCSLNFLPDHRISTYLLGKVVDTTNITTTTVSSHEFEYMIAVTLTLVAAPIATLTNVTDTNIVFVTGTALNKNFTTNCSANTLCDGINKFQISYVLGMVFLT